MNFLAFSAHQHSNPMNKIGHCSRGKSFKSTTPSIQTLTEEFKAVVFVEEMIEHQDKSTLIQFVPLTAHQDSNSDVENNFRET